jgi:hypothetical protein
MKTIRLLVLLVVAGVSFPSLYVIGYWSMVGGCGKCCPRGPYYGWPGSAIHWRRGTPGERAVAAFYAPAYWVDSRLRPAWYGEEPNRGWWE